MVDKHKIAQAVRNFLTNAIKFTPRGGEISMNLKILELAPPKQIGKQGRRSTESESDGEQTLLFDDIAAIDRPNSTSIADSISEVSSIIESVGGEGKEPVRCFVRIEVHDSGPGLAQVGFRVCSMVCACF